MSITTYFNRPGQPIDLTPLRRDIITAKEIVTIASAWFTDESLTDALLESKAKIRGWILNRADENIMEYPSFKRIQAEIDGGKDIGFVALGDDEEGLHSVMHHKFVLIDYRVVWAGSYNFTKQARNNYEALLRIEDKETALAFWDEVYNLTETAAQFADGVRAKRPREA